MLLSAVDVEPALRYELNVKEMLLKASRDSLQAQVGATEKTGRNDGLKVEQYLASVGLGKGSPYCAAGQYYVFAVAAKALGLKRSDIPVYKTGSTILMFNKAIDAGKPAKYIIKVDDLMFWRSPNKYSGHVERVVEAMKAGWVKTVGFNTSSGAKGSQRDGGGVYYRKRNIYHFLGRMTVRGFIGFKAI